MEAGELTVTGVARAIVELATKAHRGGLPPDHVSGATFTVYDTGFLRRPVRHGHRAAEPGRPTRHRSHDLTPRVVESAVGPTVDIRDVVYLTLSYGHRLIDDADAARCLTAVKAIVETAAFADELP
ncbi:2-oxo acid dehydrogenase subunit E2 [Streptomyces sp. NPDC048665]|uniref:2-oxo acid dehydrogenase subunit E2 n=1 Tax=Streptomyces sp. NPDC048665 TaxID=3155490 RepID=UPI00344A39F3